MESRSTLSIAALLALASVAVAEPPNSFWNSGTDYSYGVSGIPDFDQVRKNLTPNPGYPFCFAPNWPMQPGDPMPPGMMHCGPTTGTDLYVFMANHGYPELLPAAQIGVDWTAPANYNQGTAHIGLMGNLMGVNPAAGGCSIQGFVNGMRQAIGNKPITVKSYQAYSWWSPTLDNIAATGLNNTIMGMCYGHYQVTGMVFGNVPVVQRQGGHFVAVSGARRIANQGWLWIRDPANDCGPAPGPNLCTQSGFSDGQYQVDGGWVLILQNPFPPQYRWVNRITPGAPGPVNIGMNIKLMDGVVYIKPTNLLGRGPDNKLKIIRPAVNWNNFNLVGTGMLCEEVDFGDGVLDMDSAPDMNGAVVIAANNDGVAGARGGNIQHVDPTTGEVIVLANIPGATCVAAGQLHDFLVVGAGGNSATRIIMTPSPDQANPSGEVPPGPTSISLPHAAQAVGFDFTSGEWVMASFTAGKIMRVAEDLSGAVVVQDIPAKVPLGATGRITVRDGDVWLVTDGSSNAFHLTKEGGKRSAYLTAHEMVLQGVVQPKSIDFQGDGDMVITDSDTLMELEYDDTNDWWAPSGTPDIGVSCALRSVVSDDDVTGFVPGYHDQPDWHDNPELIEPGVDLPDPQCFADLNGDGVVDAADLGMLIGDWGPNGGSVADLNSDGIVDGADLGKLLAAWGPCFVS